MGASPSIVDAARGRRILFWADTPTIGIGAVVGLIATIFIGSPPRRPEDCINPYVPLRKRQQVAKLLAAGAPIEKYFGHAHCRICGVELGHCDLAGYGFIWPEKAEHYVLEHDVWTPELDLFYNAARRN